MKSQARPPVYEYLRYNISYKFIFVFIYTICVPAFSGIGEISINAYFPLPKFSIFTHV